MTSRRRSARASTPDVYAAANTSLPDDLHREGLVEKPVVFATNIVSPSRPTPTSTRSTSSPAPASRSQSAEGVPVGDYTREVLGRLPAASRGDPRQRALGEPDVARIVGKLTQGAVDADSSTSPTSSPPTARSRRSTAGGRRARRGLRAAAVAGRTNPEGARRSSTGCSAATAPRRSPSGVRSPRRRAECDAPPRHVRRRARSVALTSRSRSVVPVVAIFADTPPGDLIDSLGSDVAGTRSG